MNDPPCVSVKVWGDYACFTRPELKVERLSYPVMTPSAARGILDAVLFKPQMYWHIRRITVLRPWWLPDGTDRPPYQFIGVRRNEIQGKLAPRTVSGWMADPDTFEPYLVDSAGREGAGGQNRTQRNTLALRDVAYLIHATPILTDKADPAGNRPSAGDEPAGPDSVAKYVAMFQRRVSKGQCFHRPYLGCREFACHFGPPAGSEQAVDWSEDLGLMLYDIRFGTDGRNVPGFFQARITRGVLHCDTRDPGPNGEPPITVLGWEQTDRRAAS
ncbi:MAG: type I-C CRISPR-associated protein Cas5c [Phycisphaerae bacterium]